MASSREPQFGMLALVTYGLVILFVGGAVWAYKHMSAEQEVAAHSRTADLRTVQVGAIWVPAYPGAALRAPEVVAQGDTVDGSMNFTTADPAAKVLTYFQTTLGDTGYQVTANPNNAGGGTVQAIRQGGRRRVLVTVQTAREGADVVIRTLARSDER